MMDSNPPEEEPLTPTTYKKRYSSSWFYGQTDTSFPTIEEQVELCRKIASQLVNDENKESKGASMFYKRVKRAPKWVHQSTRIMTVNNGLSGSTSSLNISYEDKSGSSGGDPTGCLSEDEREQIERMKQRFRDETRKPLKLILDPRELKSVERLRKSGTSFSEHNVISPDVCHNLVKELNSPEVNKGAQIFLKRKEKSTQWIVEENQATKEIRESKERLERESENATGSELSSRPESRLSNYNQLQQQQSAAKLDSIQRVRLVKSPWEAALTGNVDNAFETVTPSQVVQTVKEVAAVKKQSSFESPFTDPAFDPQTFTGPSTVTSSTTTTTTANKVTNDPVGINYQRNYNQSLYLARAPRGWNSQEPRRDVGSQIRPVSAASFYQQHYYQPGSSAYSPLTLGASLPDSSRSSSRLGTYDQSNVAEPGTLGNFTANPISNLTNRHLNYNQHISSQRPYSAIFSQQHHHPSHPKPQHQPQRPISVEIPHYNLLSIVSSQSALPKYRDFNSSPRGFRPSKI